MLTEATTTFGLSAHEAIRASLCGATDILCRAPLWTPSSNMGKYLDGTEDTSTSKMCPEMVPTSKLHWPRLRNERHDGRLAKCFGRADGVEKKNIYLESAEIAL